MLLFGIEALVVHCEGPTSLFRQTAAETETTTVSKPVAPPRSVATAVIGREPVPDGTVNRTTAEGLGNGTVATVVFPRIMSTEATATSSDTDTRISSASPSI